MANITDNEKDILNKLFSDSGLLRTYSFLKQFFTTDFGTWLSDLYTVASAASTLVLGAAGDMAASGVAASNAAGSSTTKAAKIDHVHAVGSNAITGPMLSAGALRMLAFTGHNLAGACTATGTKIGDTVVGVVNITDGTTAKTSFESTVTVADQIQQSAASDLSAKNFILLVVAKS